VKNPRQGFLGGSVSVRDGGVSDGGVSDGGVSVSDGGVSDGGVSDDLYNSGNSWTWRMKGNADWRKMLDTGPEISGDFGSDSSEVTFADPLLITMGRGYSGSCCSSRCSSKTSLENVATV